MRRTLTIAWLCLCLGFPGANGFVPPAGAAQSSPPQVVDRIVAHIEEDIITQSEVSELSAYQELVDGHAESDDRVLNELIEQWVVNNEATATQFPAAADAEVNREVARIQGRFPSPQAYNERLAELGLTPQAAKRIVAREIYLARYLDYKFRPAVQVGDEDIAKYYKEQLVPALTAKKQTAPPLDQVTEQIRELLVQQGVTERATSWFDETKSRLKIEIAPATAASSKTTP
jgi:peptidyl-prolyl cis-trans isomerase SurA